MQDQSPPSRSLPSVGQTTAALVVAVLLPVLGLLAAYGAWNVNLQKQTVETGLHNTVSAISLAVDREVNGVESLLVAIASSKELQDGDLQAFHERVAELARLHGGWIVLTDPSGQQLVNTLFAPGAPLPRTASPQTIAPVFETAQPVYSNLFFGRAAGRQVVSVLVPVISGDAVVFSLDLTFTPERLSELLAINPLPNGMIAALIDRNGVIIARSSDPSRFVGKPAPEWFPHDGDPATITVTEGPFADGELVQATVARSALTGWTTVVTQPIGRFSAPVERAAVLVAGGGLASLIFALAAAWVIGRRITLPLQRLAGNADRIISGQVADLQAAGIAEVADVQRALLKVAQTNREKMEARLQLAWEKRARKAAELAHQEIQRRERRFRRLMDANLIGIIVANETELIETNGAFLKIVGYTTDELNELKAKWREMTPDQDLPADQQAVAEILERGECTPYEKTFRKKDGSLVHVLIGCAKVEATDLTWICYVVDLTSQMRADAERRVSEARYRALSQAMPSLVWTTAAHSTVIDTAGWQAMTGQTAEQCAGWGWLDAVHPEDRVCAMDAWRAAVEDHVPYDIECRVRDSAGDYKWYNLRGVAVRDRDGTLREWVGVCINIDERKAAEQRQTLLMAELDHRVRNILASIQAMVSLTARGAPTKEEYARRLQGRIAAMARTHGLLTDQRWKGASLRRLIEDELTAYRQTTDGILIEGEPANFILNPRTALNLSLILHELTTNAAKYGSLSVPQGRVTVTWRLVRSGAVPQLLLEWRESNGPAVVKPTQNGFGSTLIKSALGRDRGAEVTLDFAETGVLCRIILMLEHPAAETEPATRAAPRDPAALVPPSAAPKSTRVLIAEDEPMVALELTQILSSAGMQVIGPAVTVQAALTLIEHAVIDVAALDVNLKGEMVNVVADRLFARGVPVIFVTGYDQQFALPERFRDVPTLQKPVEPGVMLSQIDALLNRPAHRSSDSHSGRA